MSFLLSDKKKAIHDLVERWVPGQELEATVHNVNRSQFRRGLAHIMAEADKADKTVVTVSETLDISQEHYRFSLSDKSRISDYCKTDTIDVFTVMRKVKEGLVDVHDYGIRFNLSSEQPILLDGSKSPQLKDGLERSYRIKKRYSLLFKNGQVRVDFTIVKSATSKKRLSEVNLKETYEAEVEWIGSSKPDLGLITSILESVLCGIRGQTYLTGVNTKNKVLKEYTELIKPPGQGQGQGQASNFFFIGPKPVTLELKHLVQDNLDNELVTVLSNYSVTEKADGERYLVMVTGSGADGADADADDGSVYLINGRAEVITTKLKAPSCASSIFDCEFVTVGGEAIVLVFDAYFYKGNAVWNSMDLTKRLALAKEFVDGCKNHKPFRAALKQFEISESSGSNNTFALVKKVLRKTNSNQFGYITDGLIFTPVSNLVGQAREGSEPSLGGTWRQVYKWKPPKYNTVDFLVKEITDINLDKGSGIKSLSLNVGRTASQVKSYFEKTKGDYKAVPFIPPFNGNASDSDPCLMRVACGPDGVMRCESNEQIKDQYIVECRWDAKGGWIPFRLRQDKMDEATNGSGGGKGVRVTANSYENACAVWRSIQNPVTEDHIKGAILVNLSTVTATSADDDDVYYAEREGGSKRNNGNLFQMTRFHNICVKNNNLIKKTVQATNTNGGGAALFDMACGKGGDLNKWIKCRIKTVVGVDISEDNIVNTSNGVYARLCQMTDRSDVKFIQAPTSKYAFLPISSSEPYKKQIEKGNKDTLLRRLGNALAGEASAPSSAAPSSPFHKYRGLLAKPSFNIASCQFAIHYFFESSEILDRFIDNIDTVLKVGGYFIGTCFDGAIVNNLFKGSGTDLVERRKDQKLVWSIKKGYNEYSPTKLGQKISVFTETINRYHDEYLVPWPLLVSKMASRNLYVVTDAEAKKMNLVGGKGTGTFKELYEDLNGGQAGQMTLSTIEREFSFLNRWFIFVKKNK